MELELEIANSEQCKEFKEFIDKWAIIRKQELVNNLCNSFSSDEMVSIRGEIKGIISLQQMLTSKVDNGKVAKSMLKEL